LTKDDKSANDDADVAVMAWGFLAWFIGSIYFITVLWDRLSFRDFVLAWMACGFLVLVGGLLDLVTTPTKTAGKKANTLWKGALVILMGLSLLGPAALVLMCILALPLVWRGFKKGCALLVAKA